MVHEFTTTTLVFALVGWVLSVYFIRRYGVKKTQREYQAEMARLAAEAEKDIASLRDQIGVLHILHKSSSSEVALSLNHLSPTEDMTQYFADKKEMD